MLGGVTARRNARPQARRFVAAVAHASSQTYAPRLASRRSGSGTTAPAASAAKRRSSACGRMRPQPDLRRFAAGEDGVVIPDQQRRVASRGAYVCDDACAVTATKRRAWARAFRRAVTGPGTG